MSSYNLNLVPVIALTVSFFVAAEVLYRLRVSPIITRKITHICGGIVSALLPFFVTIYTTIALGVFLTLFLFWTKRFKTLGSVHAANSDSIGALIFPPTITLAALLYWPINPLIFQGACLVLALADGLNSIVGIYFGKRMFHVTGTKTVEGSLTFYLITIGIFFAIIAYAGVAMSPSMILYILSSSLALTCVEALLGKGWDNVFVGLGAGAILLFAL